MDDKIRDLIENVSSGPLPEPFVTVKESAETLGLPYFKLQRAVRSGLVESYTFLNSRRLVRISEVIQAIERSRRGGFDV